MDIINSFNRAFDRKSKENWDKIYVLVDLHDTVFKSDYKKSNSYEWLGSAKEALKIFSERDDICIILWTGTHQDNIEIYKRYLADNGINVDYVNENPEVGSTDIYCKDKIYFNVGIDDKFGFEPEKDWDQIIYYFN